MKSSKTRIFLILLAVVTLSVSTASNLAARSSNADCVQKCNEDRQPCQAECRADEDACHEDCLELPVVDQPACNAACDAMGFACNSACVDLSQECKAACPKGKESPSEPLP